VFLSLGPTFGEKQRVAAVGVKAATPATDLFFLAFLLLRNIRHYGELLGIAAHSRLLRKHELGCHSFAMAALFSLGNAVAPKKVK
jgi:hypothetical protein